MLNEKIVPILPGSYKNNKNVENHKMRSIKSGCVEHWILLIPYFFLILILLCKQISQLGTLFSSLVYEFL